jgi:pyrroloquinoline quinone biosynthesis protein B
MFLGREAVSSRRLPVFAAGDLRAFLAANGPWRQLMELENIRLFDLEGDRPVVPPPDDHRGSSEGGVLERVGVTPVVVPHRAEYSSTVGFVIAGPNTRVLYIPDIDRWEQWDRDLAETAAEMDVCLLDGTFYAASELESRGRSYAEVPHPLMTDTMDRLAAVIARGGTEVYFTHLNHTNRTLADGDPARSEIERRGFAVAEEGMEIAL